MTRLKNRNAQHLYKLDVASGASILVEADHRIQALQLARKAGYHITMVYFIK